MFSLASSFFIIAGDWSNGNLAASLKIKNSNIIVHKIDSNEQILEITQMSNVSGGTLTLLVLRMSEIETLDDLFGCAPWVLSGAVSKRASVGLNVVRLSVFTCAWKRSGGI